MLSPRLSHTTSASAAATALTSAPLTSATRAPPLYSWNVGTAVTPAALTAGRTASPSMSTRAKVTRPAYVDASFSMWGAAARHGPHLTA